VDLPEQLVDLAPTDVEALWKRVNPGAAVTPVRRVTQAL